MINESGVINDAGMAEPVDFTERPEHEKLVNLILNAKTSAEISQIIDEHMTDENIAELRKAAGEKLKEWGQLKSGDAQLTAAEKIRLKQKKKRTITNAERAQKELSSLLKSS